MTSSYFSLGSCVALRLLLTGAAASLLAGCADSDRFTNPFSNPFQRSQATDPVSTGSLNPSAPVSPVVSHPLAYPVQSRPLAVASPPQPPLQASPKMASAGPAMAGWSITGGSPVTVAPGESARILSQRYGVPVEALVQTNGFATASQIQPGARIIIPVYNAALAASTGARVSTVEPKPAHLDQVPAKPVQARAQTERTTIAKREENPKVVKKGPGAPPANLVAPKTIVTGASKAQVAQQTVAPTGKHNEHIEMKASASKGVVAKPIAQLEKPIAAAKPPSKGPDSRVQEAKVQEAPKAEQVPANTPADADKPSDSANPEFRWPARGRIIQGFKAGGNDGINIAVPEGTAVKAAEGGIVAYAGSELKGYGNLVLIKHPNGFVTAYANNGDLEVKRGETVKRGQTIAKSGQSGNVASPQLHFELRKGATPVDPTQYLAGL